MASTARPVILIAAVARDGTIGRDNRMPWTLPGDLAHFRKSTLGKPLLLGRRTFEAIGRPLPGRFCIVLSCDPTYRPAGVVTRTSLEAALACGHTVADQQGAPSVMIGGGAAVYRATLPLADELLITRVDMTPRGDTFFPAIDPTTWHEVHCEPAVRRPEDEASYTFCRYVRRHARQSGQFCLPHLPACHHN